MEHRKLNPKAAHIFVEQESANISPDDEAKILEEIPHKTRALAAKVATGHLSLRRLLKQIKLLTNMIRANDFSLAWKSKAIGLAGLAYFVLPTDFVPDFIPFVGYIDDGAVIAAVLRTLAHELERYSDFKKKA